MSDLKCSLLIPDVPGLTPQQITVGRPYFINCEGDFNKDFDFKKAQLVNEPQYQHILKLIKVEEVKEQYFSLQMVSYLAGQTSEAGDIKLSDGSQELNLKLTGLKVESVLTEEQQKQIKQGQEVPPFGFVIFKLDWPWVFTAGVSFSFCFVTAAIIYFIRRHLEFKKLMRGLDQYKSAVSPDAQFYKTIRSLEKTSLSAAAVLQAFKLYLARTYQIPFLELKTTQALKLFKDSYPLLRNELQKISHRINDLEQMIEKNPNLDVEEIRRYIPQLYKTIDLTEASVQKRKEQSL